MSQTDPGRKDLMLNGRRLSQGERVYKRKRAEYNFKLLVNLGMKYATWMKDIVQKFSKPENLVLDVCAGTFYV